MKHFIAGILLVAMAAPVDAGGCRSYVRPYVQYRNRVIVKKVLVPYALPVAVPFAYPIAQYSAVQYSAPAPVQVQVPLQQPQYQQPVQQVYQPPPQQYVQQQAACPTCCVPCPPCPCPPSGGTVPYPDTPTPAHPPTTDPQLPGDPPGPQPPPVGDDQAVTEILLKSCVKCHGASNPKAGLDLTLPITDPALVDEIHARTDAVGVPGYSMPPAGQLSDEDFAVIRAWWLDSRIARSK